VLASSSPRRSELLAQSGLEFEVDSLPVEEDLNPGVDPLKLARDISSRKALAVAARHAGSLVIAADTFGVLDGKFLGKPQTAQQARDMLGKLSARKHTVISGFTILDTATGKAVSRAVKTEVFFKKLSTDEIEDYVGTGEPLDKAGAYAIQGLGKKLVRRIKGDYYNVIGLPLQALKEELKKFGVSLPAVPQSGFAVDSPAR